MLKCYAASEGCYLGWRKESHRKEKDRYERKQAGQSSSVTEAVYSTTHISTEADRLHMF